MIQEFHLSITPVGQDSYWLRTETVAAGVPLAEAQVTWPVESWLRKAETLFEDPLENLLTPPTLDESTESLQGNRQSQNPAWIQLGQSLYQHLFQGRIRDSWLAAQGVAQNRRQTLRLRLGFKDSRLQRLPWELLYGDDRPLATGVDVSLCRYYQTLGTTDLTTIPVLPHKNEPVNVLVVISAPDDQERLSLRQEVETLIEDLRSRQGHPLNLSAPNNQGPQAIELNLTILEQPSRPDLAHALEQGQFQILHYAGHSDVSETGGELYLVNRQTGLTDWLSGEDLAGLLVNNGIRLAVFNSCRGAYTATDDAEAGWREQNLVQALVNRGVPGVIAMAERIPDDVAVTFTRLLYRNLQRGHAIDLCLSRVRQGLISAYRSDQPFWMLPILYLHPDFDGDLYPRLPELSADRMEPDQVQESGPLVPPDYSSDPDISGLAEEIFSGHVTGALPSLSIEHEDSLPTQTAEHQECHDLPSVMGSFTGTEQPESSKAIPDLLQTLKQPNNLNDRIETASVMNLVQQLSHPAEPDEDLTPSGQVSVASDENLLPDWPHPSADLGDKLPPDPHQESNPPRSWSRGASSWRPSQSEAELRVSQPWHQPQSLTRNLAIWVGLGIFGLLAVSGLAMLPLFRPGQDSSPTVVETPDPRLNQPSLTNEPETNIVGRDSAVITSAIGALTEDNPETAAKFITQLLDQSDIEAASGVLGSASAQQLREPPIAFVRGRLAWQEYTTGRGTGTAYDAQRYWDTAVKADPNFLEAWVALGFSHYVLGDYHGAKDAWEQAVTLDRKALQDIDPAGQRRFAFKLTTDAYAGLAMVNQKLGELSPTEREQEQYQQKAETYLSQAVNVEPMLLDPETLALEWIWSPELISFWQTAVERISTAK